MHSLDDCNNELPTLHVAYTIHAEPKPVARPVFQGWQNCTGEYLRACFILYSIKIKWTMCVQEKVALTSMSQRPRLS